jgi:hypothetical protein
MKKGTLALLGALTLGLNVRADTSPDPTGGYDISVDYSLVAGLVEYTNIYNQTAWTGMDPGYLTSPSQGVTSLWIRVSTDSNANLYYEDGDSYMKMLSYCGYIWNNSPTNETWTFICCMDANSKLFIDGELKIDQNTRGYCKTGNVVMTPGAHAFEFRYRRDGGNSGAIAANIMQSIDDEVFTGFAGNDGGEWKSKFGFAIDRQGRRSHNYRDYVSPVDPGDGSLFTYTTNLNGIASLYVQQGAFRYPDPDVDYSRVAGLGEYTNLYNGVAWDATEPCYLTSPSQGVTSLWVRVSTDANAHLYYQDGDAENKMLSYCGYVWNDSPTNETWTFACCMDAHSKLFIDGELKVNQNVRKTCRTGNVVMTPGAHAFEFRYRKLGGYSGAIAASIMQYLDDEPFTSYVGNNGGEWKSKFGFAIDRQGRGSHNYRDYVSPVDPGDGSLFVVTTNRLEVSSLENRIDFLAMKFAPNTVLDLNAEGLTTAVSSIEGLPTVTNGNLTVTGTWTIPAVDIAAGTVLNASGSLTLSAGAMPIVSNVADLPRNTVIIARAAGGLFLPEGIDGLALDPKGKFVLCQTSPTELAIKYSVQGLLIMYK